MIKVGEFNVTETSEGEYVTKRGTVNVTVGAETRTLNFHHYTWTGFAYVQGVAVKMGRGRKVWAGTLVVNMKTGKIGVTRDGNFRNPQGSGLTVVGFYEVTASNVSQHSSQHLK